MIPPAEAQKLRRKILEEMDPERHFFRLLDHAAGVLFFAKDREGRLLFANEGLLRLYGFNSEEEFIGRTDFELLPRRLAEKYRGDDLKVLQTGKPMLRIVELFLNFQGIPEWYVTTKLPIFSRKGEVLGVMGIIQEHQGLERRGEPLLDISPAVEFLKNNFRKNVPVKKLADLAGLSVRQFERKFKAAFNTMPHQFLIKLRVHAACDLLRNRRLSVADIAVDLGFYDQSAFAQHFKKCMGFTPLQYRKKYL